MSGLYPVVTETINLYFGASNKEWHLAHRCCQKVNSIHVPMSVLSWQAVKFQLFLIPISLFRNNPRGLFLLQAGALVTSENLYAFFGFFSGSCRQVLMLVGVVLGVESVATKHRLDVAAILLLFSSMGSLLVAYFYGPRHLSLKLHNVEFDINAPQVK